MVYPSLTYPRIYIPSLLTFALFRISFSTFVLLEYSPFQSALHLVSKGWNIDPTLSIPILWMTHHLPATGLFGSPKGKLCKSEKMATLYKVEVLHRRFRLTL